MGKEQKVFSGNFVKDGDDYYAVTEDQRDKKHQKMMKVIWKPTPVQQKFMSVPFEVFEVLFSGTRGSGKGLLLNEQVITDSGLKRVDEITYEDKLLAPDGTYTEIEGIYRNNNQKLYKMCFTDHTQVTVDGSHKWFVRSMKASAKEGYIVKDTDALFNTTVKYKTPLIYAPAPGKKWEGEEPYSLVIKNKCKNIPESLFCADPETRLAVLQGLMDSDGSCDKEGRCTYSSIFKSLVEGVRSLVMSLGGMATVKIKRDLDSSQVIYQATLSHANKFNPFRMPRKAERVQNVKNCARSIESIEEAGYGDTICFRVKHPSHLFVLKDFIVTHNSDALLMDFAQFVDRGFGPGWKGMIIRESFPDLRDMINKSLEWFPRIFPEAIYHHSQNYWKWPKGEKLYFQGIADEREYNRKLHGFNVPFIGFEELTSQKNLELYFKAMSICRTSTPGVPLRYRSTTNPMGPSHNAVKRRFIDAGDPCEIISDPKTGVKRTWINSKTTDNTYMMDNDPEYINRLKFSSDADPRKYKAWVLGNWDLPSGGVFDMVWDRNVHVIEPFKIPSSWSIARGFDWGSSHPYAVLWVATSDGTHIKLADGTMHAFPKGSKFVIQELYGAKEDEDNKGLQETPDVTGSKIREVEKNNYWGRWVRPGPADNQIFNKERKHRSGGYETIHQLLALGHSGRAHKTLFTTGDKTHGSRIRGIQIIRQYLYNAVQDENTEFPELYFFDHCKHCIRTIPGLPRDSKNPDDVLTTSEDHLFDTLRYLISSKPRTARITKVKGI